MKCALANAFLCSHFSTYLLMYLFNDCTLYICTHILMLSRIGIVHIQSR
jgi:hypothetical protein